MYAESLTPCNNALYDISWKNIKISKIDIIFHECSGNVNTPVMFKDL